MNRTVAALFATPETAEEARRALVEAGLAPDALRVLPLAPPPSAGAALAHGFARALADWGLAAAPADPGRHTLVIVTGDAAAALPVLESLRPLAVDRQAERWCDAHGAALEASAGLTGAASAAATGLGPTSLTAAASGLTPGRVAVPGAGSAPGLDRDPSAGTREAEDTRPSDALREAQIAAERNRSG